MIDKIYSIYRVDLKIEDFKPKINLNIIVLIDKQ